MGTDDATRLVHELREHGRLSWTDAQARQVFVDQVEPAARADEQASRLVQVAMRWPENAGKLEGAKLNGNAYVLVGLGEISRAGKLVPADEMDADLYGRAPISDEAAAAVEIGLSQIRQALEDGRPFQHGPGEALLSQQPRLQDVSKMPGIPRPAPPKIAGPSITL